MHPLIGECIGTFVLCACFLYVTKTAASSMVTQIFTAIIVGAALSVGIILSNFTGSNSYLNPVVAAAAHFTGKISSSVAAQYVAAECVGAALAVLYARS